MSESVDDTAFRTIMRRVPSPVVVVTACGADEARGITIGSFTSLSLNPPLVSFNVSDASRMANVMETCSRFAVHVLGEGQAYLANHFAAPDLSGDEQFANVSHRRDAHGTPILDGATAVLHAVPHDSTPVADHTLWIGRVVDVEGGDDHGAVLYYQRSYRGVGSELRSTLLSPVKRASNDSS
jgi:flavin reductase (DIM6/NTAB) family NADH-FMN oxidoreductase RutF